MKFIPEVTPAFRAVPRNLMEWLDRSFKRIGDWSDADVMSEFRRLNSHGGIELVTSHTRLNGLIPATSTKIPGTAYDTGASTGPVNVTQDAANGELIFHEAGFWNVSFGLVCEVDGFNNNDTAEVAVSPYNETLGAPAEIPMTGVVPRYGTYLAMSFAGNFEVPEDRLDNRISLHWSQLAGPALSVEETLLLHFTVAYQAKPGWPNV